MSSKGLALALAGLMAAPAHADEPAWPTWRLEHRAAERGPIRVRLEAALAVPARELTGQAIAASRAEASPAVAAAAGPSSSQGRSSSVPAAVWVLIGLASIVALLAEWGRAWSRM